MSGDISPAFSGADYKCGYESLLSSAAKMEENLTEQIKGSQGSMEIAEMFQIQLASNKFSQFSEMMSSLFQAKQGAIMSVARGLK